ncbi:MAG: transcriptional regulator [Glaciihabitans sp.]|nr:transcriptional regulator [Glaciihabitans sp.]
MTTKELFGSRVDLAYGSTMSSRDDPTAVPTAEPSSGLDDLRAVAHPLRLRLLSLLTGESLSAAEAARSLGDTQANVSYHLRRLADAGLVALVEETSIRGGRAKRYRHDPRSGESIGPTGIAEHTALMTAIAGELRRRSPAYRPEAPVVFTDAEVWVSPEHWQRIQDLTRELGVLVHNSAVARATPHAVPISVTAAVFEMVTTNETPQPPGVAQQPDAAQQPTNPRHPDAARQGNVST